MAEQSFDEQTLNEKVNRCMFLQLGAVSLPRSDSLVVGLSAHCANRVVEGWNLQVDFVLHLAFCLSCQKLMLEKSELTLQQLRKDENRDLSDFSHLPIQIAVICDSFFDWVWEIYEDPNQERIEAMVQQIASSPILTQGRITKKAQRKSEGAIWSGVDYLAIRNGLDRDKFPFDTLLILIFLATCYRFAMVE